MRKAGYQIGERVKERIGRIKGGSGRGQITNMNHVWEGMTHWGEDVFRRHQTQILMLPAVPTLGLMDHSARDPVPSPSAAFLPPQVLSFIFPGTYPK